VIFFDESDVHLPQPQNKSSHLLYFIVYFIVYVLSILFLSRFFFGVS
jgi:hypothetical protein